MKTIKLILVLLAIVTVISCDAQNTNTTVEDSNLIVLQSQGSFSVGGTVLTDADGKTFHGDHGYVFYQVPAQPRKYPLVFLHGIYQFSKTWETTPDGREGFQNIFLRRGFSTYNMTQPRRGHASRSTVEATVTPAFDEQRWFNVFRVGIYPDYFEGVQFPKDAESLNQYFRQQVPNIGPIDLEVNTDVIAELFDKLGGAIMVSHSHGGTHTWLTIPKTDNIKGVVAWEPAGPFFFPNNEPAPQTLFPENRFEYRMVSEAELQPFINTPIVIIYGDYIPDKPSGNPAQDEWGVRLQIAKQWAEVINKRGGDVTVVHLPEHGYKGNTHFPFSDLNNIEMADIMSEWLHNRGLD